MMLSMTETDYENWRDGLRCGGQEEYDTQYTSDEAERIYNELLDLEQKAKSEETEA